MPSSEERTRLLNPAHDPNPPRQWPHAEAREVLFAWEARADARLARIRELEAERDASRGAVEELRDGGRRLYLLLALFDTRGGTALADVVRAAREGWERSDPEMNEEDAWKEFDARWSRLRENLAAARIEAAR